MSSASVVKKINLDDKGKVLSIRKTGTKICPFRKKFVTLRLKRNNHNIIILKIK